MIEKVIPKLLERQVDIAKAAMERPTLSGDCHLLQAGQWQGIQQALDIINEFLADIGQD